MKKICLILLFAYSSTTIFSQYYFRGTITDKQGNKLQYVKIKPSASKQIYRSDIYGTFGFSSIALIDTLVFSYDGYTTLFKEVKATEPAIIILIALPSFAIAKKHFLSSVIKNNKKDWTVANETYNDLHENPFLFTKQSDEISFSASSNRASYSNIRRLINDMDGWIPPNAVRIEEILNYFNLHYTAPSGDTVFNFSSYVTSCPWNTENELFFWVASARKIDMKHIPSNNLVFLIDVSGSMDMPNKLPFIKSGFSLLVKNLRAIDTVSIVVYGAIVTVLADGLSGAEKDSLLSVINNLSANGPTPGESAIKLAYKTARKHFMKNGNNRIFLAADGDFNIGLSTEKELQGLVETEKKSGIYPTCLGVGNGNYKDSKLSVLAQKGNGNFAYIDNEQEAEKVLVTELTQTLFTVADNVYFTTTFDSALVTAYRLIGYDNEIAGIKGSSKRLEGGDIGSGNSIMAIFELNLSKTYKPKAQPIATVQLNYQLPGQHTEKEIFYECLYNPIQFKDADAGLKKAACLVMFGMKLKESGYAKSIS